MAGIAVLAWTQRVPEWALTHFRLPSAAAPRLRLVTFARGVETVLESALICFGELFGNLGASLQVADRRRQINKALHLIGSNSHGPYLEERIDRSLLSAAVTISRHRRR